MRCLTFPGQGSQAPGMGRPWLGHPSWTVVDAVAEAAGRDVARLLVHADADELRATRNAQLATFALSLVALDALVAAGARPDAAAGHSLGEYTALVAAGALDPPDGAALVAERGEAMQAAAEERPGTMAAVLGLDPPAVEEACEGRDAWVANDNAPGQVVVGGSADAVAAAGEAARAAGARRVLPLPVGGAFHTPLMAGAADRLGAALDRAPLRTARLPVVADVDARPHRRPDAWRRLLAEQLVSPVRWVACQHALADLGATVVVEVGPGSALTAMARRTLRGTAVLSVSTPEDVEAAVAELGRHPDGGPGGEHPRGEERLIVAPAAGVFTPDEHLAAGRPVASGEAVGRVGDVDVRSSFAGRIAGLLALPGERLTATQPVAWLRAATP